MKSVARLRSWLRAYLHRSRMETQMDEELRFHIEQYTKDLVAGGLPAEEARRRARADSGMMATHKEDCRDALGLRLLDDLRADCLYTARMLRQSPAFALVAVLSLALGIGANTAIFTLMETVLWKTIAVDHPEQLRILSWTAGPKAVVNSTWGGHKLTPTGVSSTVFSYLGFREMEKSFGPQAVFAFKPSGNMTAVIDGHAELVLSELVSGNFYSSAGIVPIAGRPIAPADDLRNAAPTVTVISDGFWSRRFGRDASVIGKQITINQVPVTIIGVNPPDFKGMESGENPDVFLPLTAQPVILPFQWTSNKSGSLLDDSDTWWVQVMVRLKSAASEPQIAAALDVLLARTVRESYPKEKNYDMPRIRLLTGSRGLDQLREQFSKPVFVLLSLAGLVLLICCANIANLLLARATVRQREISFRLALGAGRSRIIRQMLTEGLMLALLGGVAGLILGFWARNGIPRLFATSWSPSPVQAQFDSKVLLISLAVAFFTGILFSLAPAWKSTRVPINAALKDGMRSTTSLPNLLAGKSLVIFQICLSVLLLVGTGLFIRTLANLKSANLGFRPARILLFTIDPPRTRYAGKKRISLFLQLEQRMQAIPGIRSATLSQDALIANNSSTTSFTTPGRGPRAGEEDYALRNPVGDRFFETMGIPILYGRPLNARDRQDSPLVGVANQQFVRNFFPDGNAVGKAVVNGNKIYQIVGICGDARFRDIRSPVPPTFYNSFAQSNDVRDMTFELKTAASQASTLRVVREVVRSIDSDLPLIDIRTQTSRLTPPWPASAYLLRWRLASDCSP